MSWFNNLKIGMKLAIGFGVCLVLASVLGATAVNRMSNMDTTMHAALNDSVTGLFDLGKIIRDARHIRTLEFQHVLTDSSSVREGFEGDMATAMTDMTSAMNDYGSTVTDPVDKQNFSNLQTEWDSYLQLHNTVIALSRQDHDKQAVALLNGELRTRFDAFTTTLTAMLTWNEVHGAWYGRKVTDTYHAAAGAVISVLCVALLLATLIGAYITKRITSAIHETSDRLSGIEKVCITNLRSAVQAMESGDLTAKIVTGTEPLVITSHDELGRMGETFNSVLAQIKSTVDSFRSSQATLSVMVRGLQDSADQVTVASETLAASSEQISAGSGQISATMQEVAQATEQSARGATEVAHGATNQANALSEGAELVRQLVIAVNSVARDAESTAHSAQQANEVAGTGAAAVAQAIDGMERIRATVTQSAEVIQGLGEASTQIGAIVGTIEEIADQTNLLALNAAIEAARAGDAGRGFAVVADEVRKLAERSRLATHEIGQLIDRVQTHTRDAVTAMQVGSEEVSKGCELAEGAGDALAQIKREMAMVSDQVQSICSAAEEMLASSEEVSRSIGDVAAVVQESSAAAEEMSASAEEVSASVQTVASTVTEQAGAVQQLVAASTQLSAVAVSLKDSADRFVTDEQTPVKTSGKAPLKLVKAA